MDFLHLTIGRLRNRFSRRKPVSPWSQSIELCLNCRVRCLVGLSLALLIMLVACSNSLAQQSPAVPAPRPTDTVTRPASTHTALPPTATLASPTLELPTPTLVPTPTPAGPLAPDFVNGGAWINSEPLTLADLRGKVVLVQFWTYGCYNCQNTLPSVRAWWDTYKDQGLVIIGVHTPELSWEYPLEHVQQAVIDEEISWPVVQDNDKILWRAYRNRYWPRFYLIDHQGQIIYDHIGEGAYETTEQRIVEALAAAQTDDPLQ